MQSHLSVGYTPVEAEEKSATLIYVEEFWSFLAKKSIIDTNKSAEVFG